VSKYIGPDLFPLLVRESLSSLFPSRLLILLWIPGTAPEGPLVEAVSLVSKLLLASRGVCSLL
jgi:hypothetical protein